MSRDCESATWPYYGQDEREAADRVLASGNVNAWTGEEGRAFEREYADHLGRRRAIAVHNGTLALELALWALEIGPGDEVIVPSRTFIATASAVVMRGATPVVADVDRDSGNLTPETVAPLLTPATAAVIPVHLAGWPVDMDRIMELADAHDLHVVEDCAQAHGACYRGRPVGSIGTIGTFSFCQEKIITTGGEGGLLATDDEELYRRAWSLKDHGKEYGAVFEREHPAGFRWMHATFGTNWRMLEVQAAIGRAQLRKLPDWGRTRRAIAEAYDQAWEGLAALRVVRAPEWATHGKYKHYVYVRPEALATGWSRDRIQAELLRRGIPVSTGSCSEIYLEQAFTDAGFGPSERLPVARELGETSLMFRVHPTLKESDVDQTITAVTEVVRAATR